MPGMPSRQRSPLPALFLIPVLAIGCSRAAAGAPTTGSTVDGFKLGAPAACSPPVGVDASRYAASCAGWPEKAVSALDAEDPGHAKVVSIQTFADGAQAGPIDVTGASPLPAGPLTASTRTIFVFTLADGSTRATAVVCDTGGTCTGAASASN